MLVHTSFAQLPFCHEETDARMRPALLANWQQLAAH
jgi:hypothetical protein